MAGQRSQVTCVPSLRPYQSARWSKWPCFRCGKENILSRLSRADNVLLPECWLSEWSCPSAWTVPGPAGFGWGGTAQGSARCGAGRSSSWTGSVILWPPLWLQHTLPHSCCCRWLHTTTHFTSYQLGLLEGYTEIDYSRSLMIQIFFLNRGSCIATPWSSAFCLQPLGTNV